ncbi:unnamed protein product [Ixodes persulcatus]
MPLTGPTVLSRLLPWKATATSRMGRWKYSSAHARPSVKWSPVMFWSPECSRRNTGKASTSLCPPDAWTLPQQITNPFEWRFLMWESSWKMAGCFSFWGRVV